MNIPGTNYTFDPRTNKVFGPRGILKPRTHRRQVRFNVGGHYTRYLTIAQIREQCLGEPSKKFNRAQGEEHPMHKLTWPEVEQIREWHRQGWTTREIRRAINNFVGRHQIQRIVKGTAWKEKTDGLLSPRAQAVGPTIRCPVTTAPSPEKIYFQARIICRMTASCP